MSLKGFVYFDFDPDDISNSNLLFTIGNMKNVKGIGITTLEISRKAHARVYFQASEKEAEELANKIKETEGIKGESVSIERYKGKN
jgi:hypothetical protein